jgi:hypothetical protein
MWQLLKQSDIAQAKQQLRLRVDETLRRHAEEMKGLDHDQAELEALNRLLDDFSRKFKAAPAALTEPVAAIEPDEPVAATEPDEPVPAIEQDEPVAIEQVEPVVASRRNEAVAPVMGPTKNTVEKPAPKARNLDPRGRPQTNFDAFSRAMEKAERGGL